MRERRYLYLSLLLVWAFCLSGARSVWAQQKSLPPPPTIRATAAILVEDATGKVLFAKDPDRQLPPASTTKIVTGMLLARDLGPGTLIPVSPQAAATSGHRLGLRAGDRLSARDMLYAVMLISANDASAAVAEKIDGTEARFADHMNREALQAGATRTHFVNPHGLPASGHVSTARDLATLAHAALQVPAFAAAVRTLTYQLSAPNDHLPATLNQQDPLLSTLPGADGVKTGYTQEAGYCYVGSATRNGRRLIVAVLHSPDWQGEARQLIEYGFSLPASPQATPAHPNNTKPSGDAPAPNSPSGSTPSKGASGAGAAAAGGSVGGGQGGVGGAAPSSPTSGVGAKPTLPGGGTPPVGAVGNPLPNAPEKQKPEQSEKPTKRPSEPRSPNADRPKGAASVASTMHSGQRTPPSDSPFSFWWLWLLLLLLALLWFARRPLAQLGNHLMNRLRTALSELLRRKPAASRSVRRATQPVAVTTTREPAKATFRFSTPCVPRRPAESWLGKIMETPNRLLEPAVRRQAASILDAAPHLCSDKLLGLLSSNTLKVRLAACQLLAGAFPRRSEEALLGIIKDERTPNDARQDAAGILARQSGDRYEPTWKEMLMRDGSPAAAHALACQPRLEPSTKQEFQKILNTYAPERSQDEGSRRNAQLRRAHIALALAAHGALPEDETQSVLKELPAAPREQAVTQTLHGVASPWAVRQLVEIALNGHSYSALQGLMEVSPRLARAALDALDNPNDSELHTRARIARWLLLKEGSTKEVQQLAQEGHEVAASALNLAHLHHWQPAKSSPDALLAAAQIVSLRMGFSDHAPEQIARAFRQAASGEASAEGLAETPELLPLAEAYTHPEVYDAVQAAMHTEDGLTALMAEVARHPEQPQYAKELAFWSDKTTRATRQQIAQALAHADDEEASEALMERAEDAYPAVRASAIQALLSSKEPSAEGTERESPVEETVPPADPPALDQAA